MDIQKHTGIYATSGDVRTAVDSGVLHNPYIAIVQDGNYLDWNGGSSPTPPVPPEPVYSAMPLTFEIISGGTITWRATSTAFTKDIQYSKDNGATWTSITSSTGGTQINVNAGDKVLFKGDNATYGTSNSRFNTFSGSTAKFEVEGNIMSLINSTGFTTATTLTSKMTFYRFFQECRGLTSAENLVLPATTLAQSCYQNMFYNCTSLTTAPDLPATTLANECYAQMFCSCATLTTAPELPATTLAYRCYSDMFASCTSLTTAPELPVTTLAEGCYLAMFTRCTSLTTAPDLPATTLANECYYNMFAKCSSLNYIKCLATDISASNCTTYWVETVAASGTFVKNPAMSSWPTGFDGIPEGWTVIDAEL